MPRTEDVVKSAKKAGGFIRKPRLAQIAVDWMMKLYHDDLARRLD